MRGLTATPASALPRPEAIRLLRENVLADQVVLVDGFTRSGKSMLGPILASLERVEIERVEAIFEYTALLHSLGKIAPDAAAQLLRLEADTKLYESRIGRNVNWRYRDHSGVFNNPFKLRYLARLFGPDGQAVLETMRAEKPIFQVQTHDTLGMIDPFYPAFGKGLRVLEMIRDPIDLAHSWYRRGWGDRFTSDPLSFTFTYEGSDGQAPWYGLLLEEGYNSMPAVDRILRMILGLYRRTVDKVRSLDEEQRRQILWIPFERFVTAPEADLARIESFLGTRRTPGTAGVLKRERCPRSLPAADREKKRRELREKASDRAWKALDEVHDIHRWMESLA